MTSQKPPDRLGLAIGTIVFACFALSLGDAMIKGASDEFALWQIFLWRSALAMPVLLVMMGVLVPRDQWWPTAPFWVILRSALLVVMWVVYYLCLPHLGLSVAAAAYYTLPIFMVLFSALLLREQIGPMGWAAAVLGFVGVVVLLRPSPDTVSVYMILPLLAAMLYALAMTLTRARLRGEHPLALAFHLAQGFLIAGLGWGLFTGAASASFWPGSETGTWPVLILMAAAMVIGGFGGALAYQNGPPSVVGVFDFSYVGFAVIWGIVLFGEAPAPVTVLGIGMIVAAGCLALLRAS